MSDIETLLGEEAVDPHTEQRDRASQEKLSSNEVRLRQHREGETLPVIVRSPERRAEAFLSEWLRRLGRS